MSPKPQGEVIIEGDFATLAFERFLPHPPRAVWSAITDPNELKSWFMTKGTVDGRKGGAVDLVSGPSQLHWTGKILTWEPHRIYEYEWHIDARAELPKGERTIVRWELKPHEGGTLLTLRHSRLTKNTALGFAPGTHAFLDRLAAQLDQAPLPEWGKRYAELAPSYPPMERRP